MALYKQKGSANWWVSIYMGKGVPRFRASTGTSDKDKARTVEAAFMMAKKKSLPRERIIESIDTLLGFNQIESGIPIDQIEETYSSLPDLRESAGTITTRCAHIRDMAAWIAENWPSISYMHQINRAAAVAYADHLRTACRTGKTYNNRRGNLVRVFNLLLVRGGCAENVWALTATASTADSKSGRAFDRDEMQALYAACKSAGHQWYPITVIARYTGLRYGDIANLRGDDIKDGCICLRPSKTAKKKIRVIIPMHREVQRIIDDLEISKSHLFSDHAFSDYQHRPLKGEYANVLKKAKIKPKGAKLSFHCLRHTFRTELARAGVAQDIAMKLGGWTEGDTAELYNHDTSQLRSAIEAMD
jgi:integrase